MCRLFCQFSVAPQGIAEPLREGPFSLRTLSMSDRRRLQSDGWGVGWIADQGPRVMKSAGAIYHEPARVTRAINAVFSRTTVGHIRRASNPLKLPKKALAGLPHSQPFTHGRWLFCHNGTLAIPREVKAALGPWKRFVKSKNDSEVLFYWLLKTVVASADAGTPGGARPAEHAAARPDLAAVPVRASRPALPHAPGLNWVLTDGEQLFSFCYANPDGFRQGGALGHKKQPYFALQVRNTPDARARLTSLPLRKAWDVDSRWKTLGHGTLLVVRRRKNVLLHRRSHIL